MFNQEKNGFVIAGSAVLAEVIKLTSKIMAEMFIKNSGNDAAKKMLDSTKLMEKLLTGKISKQEEDSLIHDEDLKTLEQLAEIIALIDEKIKISQSS